MPIGEFDHIENLYNIMALLAQRIAELESAVGIPED